MLRRISGDNIKMYFEDIGSKGVDCIHSTQDRDQFRALLNTVLNTSLR